MVVEGDSESEIYVCCTVPVLIMNDYGIVRVPHGSIRNFPFCVAQMLVCQLACCFYTFECSSHPVGIG